MIFKLIDTEVMWPSYHFYHHDNLVSKSDLEIKEIQLAKNCWSPTKEKGSLSNKGSLINPYHQNSNDDFCFCVLTAILHLQWTLLLLLSILHYSNVKITLTIHTACCCIYTLMLNLPPHCHCNLSSSFMLHLN